MDILNGSNKKEKIPQGIEQLKDSYLIHYTPFFYKNRVFLSRVKYSYNLAKYKREIILTYSYFSE